MSSLIYLSHKIPHSSLYLMFHPLKWALQLTQHSQSVGYRISLQLSRMTFDIFVVNQPVALEFHPLESSLLRTFSLDMVLDLELLPFHLILHILSITGKNFIGKFILYQQLFSYFVWWSQEGLHIVNWSVLFENWWIFTCIKFSTFFPHDKVVFKPQV